MAPRIALLLIIVNWASSTTISQTYVLGKFSIGNPSVKHSLTTKRGDKFEGWIAAWNADSLVLVTKNDQRIAFPPQEIDVVLGLPESVHTSTATQLHELTTKNGNIFYGYPTFINRKLIKFTSVGSGQMRFKTSNVEYIRPEMVSLLFDRNYENEYIYLGIGERSQGQLLLYHNGVISNRLEDGKEQKIDIFEEGKYKLLPQRLPYTGHRRSLMFAQTGFGMKPREKEFRNIAVGINIMSFGINESISVATGLVGILPYGDIKFSKSFGKYLHASIGAYGVLPTGAGVHAAVSIGTPNFFVNVGYNNNFDNENLYTYSDFESFNVGLSAKVGRRGRLFTEMHILTAPNEMGEDEYFDLYWETGYLNPLTIGYGWFNYRFRFETGIVGLGPFRKYDCFPFECTDSYTVPVPFFSMAYNIR